MVKSSKLNSKNGSRHFDSKKVVKMYLLHFSATPAPSPATELHSDSQLGDVTVSSQHKPLVPGHPRQAEPPAEGTCPSRSHQAAHLRGGRSSPLSSSTCHITNAKHPATAAHGGHPAPLLPTSPSHCRGLLSPSRAQLPASPCHPCCPRGLTCWYLLPPASPPLPSPPGQACPVLLQVLPAPSEFRNSFCPEP